MYNSFVGIILNNSILQFDRSKCKQFSRKMGRKNILNVSQKQLLDKILDTVKKNR